MTSVVVDRVAKVFADGTAAPHAALDDVTFSVSPGEAVSLVGPNGAGKSTLLRVVAGILTPTRGMVHRPARCASLIELGGAFQTDLTGAENLELSLAMGGLGRRERAAVRDEVVEFAGLASAMDRQLKHFSSGMVARLAAAVAVHTAPDLLLVDEVLAVGDASFQRRILDAVGQLVADGAVLLLVTHSLDLAAVATNRTIWLADGKVEADGPADEVLARYEHVVSGWGRDLGHHGVRIEQVRLEPAALEPGDPLRVVADVVCDRPLEELQVRVDVRPAVGSDHQWMRAADESAEERQANMVAATTPVRGVDLSEGRHRLELVVPSFLVSSSVLELTVVVADHHHRPLDELPVELAVGRAGQRPHYHLVATELA